MITATQRPLARTLFAAGLALVGTFASFAVTASPAAAGGIYRATLSAPLAAPRAAVLGSALWRCDGADCRAGAEDSAPANSCARVVREFGAVASFTSSRGEFSAEQLARCNTRA
jgi:hypothetical protein